MRHNLMWFCLLAIIANSFVKSDIINFKGKIAGSRTISECVNGYELKAMDDPEKKFITTSQLIRETGYPAEEHVVQTDDGYVLTVHRIPGKSGAPPVFLQHGLLSSSYDWVLAGKNKALALKLADAGYDVWLGNVRGNTYSRCHTKYTTSDFEFWDFSWHEIGIHDLPAMITYVADTTGQKIIYIGHSMGTTAFFVMAIERPDIASKLKLMLALAPVAFMNHATTPLRILAPYTRQIELLVNSIGTSEFLSQSSTLRTLVKYLCTLSTPQKRMCAKLLIFATDFNSAQFNYTLLPDVLYHFPAGTPMKIFNHYFQEVNSGRFRNYDYGAEKNLKLYNSNEPPDYDISKITIPVGLFWSDSDAFANPVDVARLYQQLPNVVVNYRVPYPNFHHADFLYAINAPELVYEKLISFINNYR